MKSMLLPVFMFAEVNKSKLVDCYEIFEQRRAELEAEVAKIEEQRQAFIALKDASMNILKKKEAKIESLLRTNGKFNFSQIKKISFLLGLNINNLKNINVKIPKNKMTVITGVSGS